MSTLTTRLIEIADSLGNDADLARIAGLSRSAVSQWRAGDVKSLKAESALRIQEKTGYSARWLVLGLGSKKLVNKASFEVLPIQDHWLSQRNEKMLLALLKIFFEATDEDKVNILEAAEAAVGNGNGGQQEQSKSRRTGPHR